MNYNCTPEQELTLQKAQLALKLKAHEYVMLVINGKDADYAENELWLAARDFSAAVDAINPYLFKRIACEPCACAPEPAANS